MNRGVRLTLICLFLMAGWPTRIAADRSSDFLVTGMSIGRIRIGDTKREAVRRYNDARLVEVDLLQEGLPSPALQAYRDGELLLTVELDGDRVFRLRTTNQRFSTKEAIRIGSSFRRLTHAYGKPVYVGGGEGGTYAVFDRSDGRLSFRLDVAPGAPPEEQSKIIEILVTKP